MTHRITILPGDGIGPEVVAAAQRVVEASGVDVAWEQRRIGYLATDGEGPLPESALESIRRNRVALKGPVATSTSGLPSANVALRRALELFVQVRPARSLPVPAATRFGEVDVVVVRETTEDLYRGIEIPAGTADAEEFASWLASRGYDEELGPRPGFSIKPTTERAVRRAAEFTLSWMRRHGRRRLTVVHKATVMRATDGIFLHVADELAATTTDIEIDRCQVDGACAQLIRDPGRFDVLFMPNMYGDIVSDVAAALTGGLGMAPGANHGDDIAVFEPVHGTAPAHAGRDEANPLAMIRSASLLLAHLGEREAGLRVDGAVEQLARDGRHLTYDLLGTHDGAATTSGVAEALVAILSR